MAVSVITGGIQVNSIRNNSKLNQGKNVSNGWSITTKTNLCVGEVGGNLNLIPSGVNILKDCDLLDGPTNNTIGPSPTGGSVVEVI
ncbi:hypothetical protein [Desulfoscipio geothermicus]|uniref:Uncharacterized protein n=1 Tax=Desulfoscipio geothermicus DSM 3669 TaxID=1121426 RepID=A0A1I6DTA6_9FIRM|nr:hypothetical protein [Desulfoscipio geothermicus]SFR08714.1 hypothetical protein SAMN05660706_11741 [Desulfoscipio geothermicus DSM 3669]